MNKKQCEELIISLHEDNDEDSQNCISIGSVLRWRQAWENHQELLGVWKRCGIDKSLHEIMTDSGFEDSEKIVIKAKKEVFGGKPVASMVKQLKDPNARELFKFLNEIFKS